MKGLRLPLGLLLFRRDPLMEIHRQVTRLLSRRERPDHSIAKGDVVRSRDRYGSRFGPSWFVVRDVNHSHRSLSVALTYLDSDGNPIHGSLLVWPLYSVVKAGLETSRGTLVKLNATQAEMKPLTSKRSRNPS